MREADTGSGQRRSGGAAGRVQRFKMLEIVWMKLEITFNVIVSSDILLLRFMS